VSEPLDQWNDRWCDWHHHLESHWVCDGFDDDNRRLYDDIFDVTVTVTKKEKSE
jgi:hypothetical protein